MSAYIKKTTRTRRSHPVEWLFKHRNPTTRKTYISIREYEAYENFICDALQFLGQYRTQRWDDMPTKKGYSVSDTYIHLPALAVRRRFQKALCLLREYKDFMIDICLGGINLGRAEKKYRLKKGFAKHIIKQKLGILHHFYELC